MANYKWNMRGLWVHREAWKPNIDLLKCVTARRIVFQHCLTGLLST
jgi:hypothetical protein